MKSIKHWILSAAAIGITAYLLPGVHVTVLGAFILAVVLALINMFIKPLVYLVTLPINIITIGLFSFIINAGCVLLADKIVKDFSVSGFVTALLFAVILSCVNVVFSPIKNEKTL